MPHLLSSRRSLPGFTDARFGPPRRRGVALLVAALVLPVAVGCRAPRPAEFPMGLTPAGGSVALATCAASTPSSAAISGAAPRLHRAAFAFLVTSLVHAPDRGAWLRSQAKRKAHRVVSRARTAGLRVLDRLALRLGAR